MKSTLRAVPDAPKEPPTNSAGRPEARTSAKPTSVLAPLFAIDAILQDVAELPDDYADEDPDVLRVSVDDLRVILERHL